MPPYEIERKFLIRKPDLLNLAAICRVKEISQTYLTAPEGVVRIRRTEERGKITYTETTKRNISNIRRVEIERDLTEEEYLRRMATRDPRRQTIRKVRYCLPFEGHVFEIDIYPFWSRQAVMEIELKEEGEPFNVPPFLQILREVTNEPQFSNYQLARAIPEEDQK